MLRWTTTIRTARRRTGSKPTDFYTGETMKKLLTMKHSLELLAAVIAIAALLGVLQTFIIGKHFVIPTMMLALAVLFGNLARSGMRGERWAQHVLFWMFFIAAWHTFFALFHAVTPKAMLGAAFHYVYGTALVIFALLSWQYAKRNELLKQ